MKNPRQPLLSMNLYYTKLLAGKISIPFISLQWTKNIGGRNVQFKHIFIFLTCKIPVFVNVVIKITNPAAFV